MENEKIVEEIARIMLEQSQRADVEPVLEIDGKEIVLGENITIILNNVLEQAFIPFLAQQLYNAGYRKEIQGEWISVDERLPTKDEYLTHHNDGLDTLKRITVAYMTDTLEYDIACYDGYKWLNQLCTRVIKDVIAWKPFEVYTPKMKGAE